MSPTKKQKQKSSKQPSANLLTDEYLFFLMPTAEYGEFCQWYPSKFAVSKADIRAAVEKPHGDLLPEWQDYVHFGCAEQYMMYCKGARFHDVEGQRRVLATDSPKDQKRLGKLMGGFTDESWDEVKSAVVELGNMAKFEQNGRLRQRLLGTGDRILCEAASSDRIWGIGYNAGRALSMREFWGENQLGKALMAARTRLRTADGLEERLEQESMEEENHTGGDEQADVDTREEAGEVEMTEPSTAT